MVKMPSLKQELVQTLSYVKGSKHLGWTSQQDWGSHERGFSWRQTEMLSASELW